MAVTASYPLRFKILVTVWTFMENILFSGLRAGWPALVYVLKKEHIYSYLCANVSHPQSHTPGFTDSAINVDNNPNPVLHQSVYEVNLPHNFTLDCGDQDIAFNRCFTIASALMASSALLYGHLNFRFGIRAPRILSALLFIGGCLCLAFVSVELPWLIYPGLVLISAGGNALYITNSQVSYFFTTGAVTVIGLQCGALEASSFIQSLIKIGYEHGVSLRLAYLILGASYLLTLVSTFLFFPKHFIIGKVRKEIIQTKTSGKDDGKPDEGKIESVGNLRRTTDIVTDDEEDQQRNSTAGNAILAYGDTAHSINNQSRDGQICSDISTHDADVAPSQRLETPTAETNTETKRPSIWRSLCSKTYLLYLFWASVVQIVLSLALGTFNPWLEFVLDEDSDKVSLYTDILYYSMLGSPFLALSFGLAMDALQAWRKAERSFRARTMFSAAVCLGATSILSVLVCVLFMLSKTDSLVPTSLALVAFRTSLYSCGTGFLRIMYPTQNFGILCGVMSMTAGGLSFLQYPLFLLVQNGNNAWPQVFGGVGVLGLLSLSQPVSLLWGSFRG